MPPKFPIDYEPGTRHFYLIDKETGEKMSEIFQMKEIIPKPWPIDDIETETDAMLADPLTFFQDIKSEYDSGEIDERTAYLRIVSAHLFMLAQTCAAPPPVMLGIDIHHDVYMGAIEKIRLCVDYAFDNMDEFPGEARKALTTIDEIVEKTGVQFSEDDLPESLKALAANAKPLNGDNITDNLGDILCAVLGGMSNTGV